MYRLLFMDGELLDTVRRRPPRVTGDGRSTIRELIAAENAGRLDPAHPVSMPILRVDLDCLFTLEAAGLSLESVLPADTTIPVKTVTSQNRIEDNETVTGADCARSGGRGARGRSASGGATCRRGLNNAGFEPMSKGVRRRDNRGQRHPRASLPLSGR